MKKTLLVLTLLTLVAGGSNAIDRKNGGKKSARKAKTECGTKAKAGCCAGMKHCDEKMKM